MKIVFQIPKTDPEKQAELLLQKWLKVKEPNSIFTAILFSIPFMILGLTITIMLMSMFKSANLENYGAHDGTISFNFNILFITNIVLLLLLHELIHLILVPNFLKSPNTGLGIQFFGGFVFTEEIMSRKRFILISIAPFGVISIILPLILGAIGCLGPTLIFLMLLNALGSSVDLLNVWLILFQVPKEAKIMNSGMSTFWKV
ncbi:DUF3267 domain-containing protein [Paenibacillus sp. FJAT-27812]|uniref:DUF3267 domain-containing protein n=1 Tax=Paenibacillus sp. FJAT-27812 TaxID=1684143 RepID=UPI0006A7EECC|nr:DUF3267 domain-containing protein [Paenibacillus sp. FJAT-27812]